MTQKPQWATTALAVAAAISIGLSASEAHALALGRVVVQSALGEPLRADIEIPEINADEVASLKAAVASPEAFRAAGLEFSPAISNAQITLQRRADGRYFLRLSSDRPVNEPFVDLILEANWSSGRIVRDYTMLFDPPNMRPAPPPPIPAQVSPTVPSAPTAATPRPAIPATPAVTGTGSARMPAGRPATVPATSAGPRAGDGQRVTVQNGDTAGRIAATYKPATISLDQMLVALLRTNPDAFSGGNVNRLRAGSVLDVPSAEEAAASSATEARQTVIAQSRDFNEFRRRLAEGLTTARVGSANREASGKVQALVEERKPAATAPDKLTLSKGALQAKAAEDKIARDRAARDAAVRVAELNKNIGDLNRLGVPTPAASAPKPATPVAAAKPASAPAAVVAAAPKAAVAVPAPAPAVAPAPPVSPPPAPPPPPAPVAPPAVVAPPPAVVAAVPAAVVASASSSPASAPASTAPAPTVTASAPAAVAVPIAVPSAPRKPVTPPAPVETSLVDDLLENPLIPGAAVGLLALLGGFAFWRIRQRKKSSQVDSSFLESRLQPDSFFGASGGQRIDTAEGSSVTGSSMVYSPSQLDAAGDVDPVAEADVYLAYGRDLQAEEILKEALRTNPQRVAIHSKLLEIYSKRRDTKSFEMAATEAYRLTRGEGQEWEHICALGREFDPSNPLYSPGGQPSDSSAAISAAGGFAALATQPMPMEQPSAAADVDLDLDFSLDEPEPAPMFSSEQTVALKTSSAARPEFGAVSTVALAPQPPIAPIFEEAKPVRLAAPELTLPGSSLDFSATMTQPTVAVQPAPADVDSGMIEFDLGALSLDLDSPAPTSTSGAPLSTAGFDDTGGDPLATKLALAQEFNAIGDADGARSLAEEVVAEASGELKSRAQRFLAEIG